MPFKISNLISYFKVNERVIKRGEQHVDANHVIFLNFDHGHLSGKVKASMRKIIYNVSLHLSEDHSIISAKCECAKGLSTCGHMAALYIQAIREISVTDLPCSWKNSSSKKYTIKTCSEMYCLKSPYTAVSRTVDDDDKDWLLQQLKDYPVTTGMEFLLTPDPQCTHHNDSSNNLYISNILSTLSGNSNVNHMKEALTLTSDVISEIAIKTVGQGRNEMWHDIRKGRLTSSIFGNIIKCKNYSPKFIQSIINSRNLSGVKAVKWGLDNESVAISEFSKKTSLQVIETGIWLSESGFLGASPDGLVGDNAIIEVKCPYSKRFDTISDALLTDFYLYMENGEIKLKDNHNYYHQVQGQLHITNRKICYFVVWTYKDLAVIEIQKDETWDVHLDLLDHFYFNYYLPQLVQEKECKIILETTSDCESEQAITMIEEI